MSARSKLVCGILASLSFSILALTSVLAGSPGSDDTRWQPGAIAHAQHMRQFPDADGGRQPTPPVIPGYEVDNDPSGAIATYQPSGPTVTSQNPFFQSLGTNNRTCFTCHQPANGWGVSAEAVQARFATSLGTDPIFRLVDGATCPSDNVSNFFAKRQAFSLLLNKGLIRIGLPIPANAQFSVSGVDDPYNCNTNPVTGLTGPTAGTASVYRRPLPATNLGFLSTIMWDGREPSLASQATDATLGHAQANFAPTADQVQSIVNFESGVFTAQTFDDDAGSLNTDGATGGPVSLYQQLASFFIGINDPLGQNPKGLPFSNVIFDLYASWTGDAHIHQASFGSPSFGSPSFGSPSFGSPSFGSQGHGGGDTQAARESVARGEAVFNNTPINITGVGGLNDALGQPSIAGFCGTCHDTPNVGNHSVKAPLNIGIADAGANAPPALDISALPVFTLQCNAGPLAGQTFTVTDPGRALISGNCADIGKLKGPILRGLAGRAPYFHNGSAATLDDVVEFYNQRFNIGFTEQQKEDLVAFLKTL